MQNGLAIAQKAQSALKRATKQGTLSGLPSAEIENVLRPYALAIQNALPNGGKPDRIIQMAVFQITNDPKLAECTVKSVIGCILNASLLGINPALKQCFFIPYNNSATGGKEAQFQLSYTGMLSLARRSGIVKEVYAEVVRKGDTFKVQYGTDRKITHEPDMMGNSERELLYAYAVIHYQHGGCEFVVMDRAEIEKRRLKSRGQKGAPTGVWLEWEPEMWKKTVLRNLLGKAPLSDENAAAISTDGATLRPENFNRGEIAPETVVHSDYEVITEAEDIQAIREGVEDCVDLDTLERYWKQGEPMWVARTDIIEIFTARKLALTNG